MRYTAAHSTSCCGAHSYSGFGRNENNDPNIINATMQQGPVGRLADITLNRDQITQNPVMMQRLADLGFVLDAHWINSVHDSDVYRFTRCDRRRPLLAGIENAWNGMVLTAGLNGDLPAVPNRAVAGAGARVGRLRFQPGDRVRVNTQASRRYGREFVIEDCLNNGNDYIARMRDDLEGNAMFGISFNSLQLVQAVGARPEQPVVPQRHQDAQVALIDRFEIEAAADRAPAPRAPHRVFAYYHCVFRDGRRGAGYQTFAQATQNLGRRTRIDRFEIMSDGTTRWVESVRD